MTDDMRNTTAMLKDAIDTLMHYETEIDAHREEQKAIYSDLKGAGFNVPVIRKIISRMKKDRTAVIEEDEALYTLEGTLGMKLPDW